MAATILNVPVDITATNIIPSISAGADRSVYLTVCMYSGGGTAATPTSVTCNGRSATFVCGDAMGVAQTRLVIATYRFLESDVAAISGNVYSCSGQVGSVRFTVAFSVQDSYQGTLTNYNSGRATSGTITLPLTRANNSLSVHNAYTNYGSSTALTLANPARDGIFSFANGTFSYGYEADTSGTLDATCVVNGNYVSSLAFNVAPAAPVPTITSINGGNPITAGQTGIAIEATGFSAKPTAVTATYASGAKSITATVDSGGSATNFNISIQDRIEAEDWPINGDTLTFTFTYLSESASGTQTLVKKADEVVLTVSSGITSDPATWTYWLTQDGFTVEGGENVYDPYGDLVLTADGGGSVTNAGSFTSWFRPATGTGAGNVYAYTWVVSEAGIQPASGLTSSGLTSSGLTRIGLTSSGL